MVLTTMVVIRDAESPEHVLEQIAASKMDLMELTPKPAAKPRRGDLTPAEWHVKLVEDAEKKGLKGVVNLLSDGAPSAVAVDFAAHLSGALGSQKPEELLAWLQDDKNVPADTRKSKEFVATVFKLCLKEACKNTVPLDAEDKAQIKVEQKAVIKLFTKLVKPLLDGHTEKVTNAMQLECMFQIQQFLFETGNKKAMGCRLMERFYDLDVLEEDAINQWKEFEGQMPEGIDEAGKMKMLFNITKFLTWLEEADEDDDDDEDED